jgi:hypothetical protein
MAATKKTPTTPPNSDAEEDMEREMKAALEEGEPKRKNKRKRKANKPKEVKSSKGNRWIDFYMKWREENPEIVSSIHDVKQLVQLARKVYTPVSKSVFCTKCGHENEPPFKRNP